MNYYLQEALAWVATDPEGAAHSLAQAQEEIDRLRAELAALQYRHS